MESFGELLTRHMNRTGISDSELARYLGISRQTVFRWKEGLTARPRERGDVLKIAARLRLSGPERDALLLAAGFPPEAAPVAPTPIQAPTPAAESAPPGQPQPLTPSPTPAPTRVRTRPRWLPAALALALIILLGIVAFSVTFLNRAENSQIAAVTAVPTSAPITGEQTILLGRLQSAGGDAPTYDVTARLRQAVEREIDAARLDHVRILISPSEIADPLTAETARVRANALVALWGTYRGAATTLQLTPAAAQTLSFELDSGSTDHLRALALLLVARLAQERANPDLARATLTQALALPNLPPSFLAYLTAQRQELQ